MDESHLKRLCLRIHISENVCWCPNPFLKIRAQRYMAEWCKNQSSKTALFCRFFEGRRVLECATDF
jgi:hypothetical protein